MLAFASKKKCCLPYLHIDHARVFYLFVFFWVKGPVLGDFSYFFGSPAVHSVVYFIQHIVGVHWEHCWVSDCHNFESQLTFSWSFSKLERMGITVAKEEIQEMVTDFLSYSRYQFKVCIVFSCLWQGICWTISLDGWVQAALWKGKRSKLVSAGFLEV